ncbi:ABC transporter ATP-binding protein [Nocardia cyriacigeorgica]|uniref:Multidrug export ATP-binding/permease protein SAV1866 n=1 Tax=Nocardia cyriacigeorgica TaxID=135487 RepID=A0A4U8W671_9NOCA|nr:ABC transporter ATP-binding protein [Nocardia cyriacigeorgica]VFB00746.1 Putative multidrug export ATP-binding/permease protein SAV1866 [Nocardia cyriacigeorgica]
MSSTDGSVPAQESGAGTAVLERTDEAADWRGIANEDKEVTETGNLVLAARSRRLLAELVRPYRKLAALALAIIVVDNAATVVGPLFVAYGLDRGISAGRDGNWAPLLWAAGGYLGAALLGGLTTFCFVRVAGRLSQNVLFDLRVRAFAHVQQLDVEFHEKYTSGKVVARLTGDIETLQELLEGALNEALSAILSVLTIAVLLVYLDLTLAAVVFAGFVPLFLVTRWAQRRQRAGYRRTRGAIAKVVVQFVESMGGMRAVQAFRREERNETVLAVEDGAYREANVTAVRGMGEYAGLTRLLGNLTTVVVIIVGAWQVIDGHLAVGVLAAYLLYLKNFYGPLDELAQVFNSYQSAAAALEKISGVLEERPAVAEPTDPVPLGKVAGGMRLDRVWFDYASRPGGADEVGAERGAGAAHRDATVAGAVSGGAESAVGGPEAALDGAEPAPGAAESATVAVEHGVGGAGHATAAADPGARAADQVAGGADDGPGGHSARGPVLPEMSLDIPAGQVVALVGPTGAGKSTLAKLLTRFYDPSGGVVTLDGIDLRRISDADLRRHVVMVTQEAYLFSGSVADNIRLGRPDATDAEVHDAARAVGLYDFVRALPEGFDTDVRKRGGRLSAGQRQLVAFARVFLADPAVIVLDEATSSLDIPSERLVQDALETVLRDRTAVIIAHRLSTVAIADRVLVLEAGRVVEDGAPQELIAGNGRFAGLHAAWRESLV